MKAIPQSMSLKIWTIKTLFLKTMAVALGTALLTACGGGNEPPGQQNNNYASCAPMNGRTYYSTTLEEAGETPAGTHLGHWSVRFENGTVQLLQSDFGLIGTYSCRHSSVNITLSDGSQHNFLARDDYAEFDLNPLGTRSVTYRVGTPSPSGSDACAAVAYRRYSSAAPARADAIAPPADPIYFDFIDRQRVNIGVGDSRYSGLYDCTTGFLHVHEAPADATPHGVRVQGENIEVFLDGRSGAGRSLYYQPPLSCGAPQAPVCAAVESPQPCATAPCPALLYKTFADTCAAQAAKVREIIHRDECGEQEGRRVTEILAPCPPQANPPQCAKEISDVVCVTEPCPTHVYKTHPFGFCPSHDTVGNVVFEGECEALEGEPASGEPAVRLVATLATTEKTVRIDAVRFSGDTLTLGLGYTSCGEQHFGLQIADSFLESFPVQVRLVFKPVREDDCDAAWHTTFSYDLTPLKYHYQRAYGTQTGEIVLPGIGTYRF